MVYLLLLLDDRFPLHRTVVDPLATIDCQVQVDLVSVVALLRQRCSSRGLRVLFLLLLWWICVLEELLSKVVHLVRQHICHWKEIIVLGKLLAHEHQILSEPILVRDHVDARPLTYALIRFESI